MSHLDKGFALDYTVTGTRGTKVGLVKAIPMYGHPKALRMLCRTGESNISSLTVNVRAENEVQPKSFAVNDLTAGEERELYIDFAELFDTDDLGAFPINFATINIMPSDATGKVCHLEFPVFEAVYDTEGGAEAIKAGDSATFSVADGIVTIAGEPTDIRVYDTAGRLCASAEKATSIALPEATGVYLVMTPKATFKVEK